MSSHTKGLIAFLLLLCVLALVTGCDTWELGTTAEETTVCEARPSDCRPQAREDSLYCPTCR